MTKYTLITGATSGIGYELACCCARHGRNVVVSGRNETALANLAKELAVQHGVQALPVAADLSLPGSHCALWDEICARGAEVEILINNAGFGRFGLFADSPWQEAQAMIAVNILALTGLTRLALPGMVKRREGRILNVSSTAGFRPGPLMAVYFATKAYVLSFSEALSEELRGSGVSVTTYCPGATSTGFARSAGLEKSQFFTLKKQADPRDVAASVYDHLMRRDGVVIHGLLNRLMLGAQKLLPRRTLLMLSRAVRERK